MIIVLVDDEPAALRLLKNAVQEAVPSAECHPFEKAADALMFAKQKTVDIAFLDIHMQSMTGLELAQLLKKENPLVNLIFVTGDTVYMADAISMHASGYVNKPITSSDVREQINNLLHPVQTPTQMQSGAYARTFGYFDFLVGGIPLSFKREKSKELLALLIDRDGAALTTEQMATILYEDRNYDRSVKNTLMPVIRSLQETLREAGVESVLLKSWGHLAVDPTQFQSDARDYYAGKPYAINAFHGEYMSQYSWAEERTGEFYWKKME